MAIIYNWVVEQMDCYPTEQSLADVVFCVHYRYQGTEVDGDKTYFAEVYGTVNLSAPDPANFTPYNDLTKAQVEGWLSSALNTASLQANIATQIQNQKVPPVVSPALPWASGGSN